MKKIFVMLIITISAIASVNAQSPRKHAVQKPTNVIKQLNYTIDNYGQKNNLSYSVTKNPNTNLLELSEKIAHFTLKKADANQQLDLIREAFTKDESVGYQFKHIMPGNNELFNLNVLSGNGKTNNTLSIRVRPEQEMWYMCCKNPENPQLRDAYAIVWKESGQGYEGNIYMITSLRPDLFTKNMTSASNTFKLDGIMGYDLKDTLYVFYMADSYEELERLGSRTNSFAELKRLAETDPQFIGKIAYMPIKNNRFNISVNINKRMVGRQRNVEPDGSLCKLWMDIDMVPGETYRLVVHNGFVEYDNKYETRFGRYSGHSLIGRYARDEEDTEATQAAPTNDKENIPTQLRDEVRKKFEIISENMSMIKKFYETIDDNTDQALKRDGKIKDWSNTDMYFNQIFKQNEQLDLQIEELYYSLSDYELPLKYKVGIYKEILRVYADQNNYFNDLYSKLGNLSKSGKKCQKQISQLTEKYMNRMSEAINSGQ